MYTSKGNKRLKKLASDYKNKMIAAAKKATSDSQFKKTAARKVLEGYIKAWRKLGGSKSYGESGDTAVREQIGDFFDTLSNSIYDNDWDAKDYKADWDTVYDKFG